MESRILSKKSLELCSQQFNLPVTATVSDIERRFREMSIETHPDKFTDEAKKAEATERFQYLKYLKDHWIIHINEGTQVVVETIDEESLRKINEYFSRYLSNTFVLKERGEFNQDLMSQQEALLDFYKLIGENLSQDQAAIFEPAVVTSGPTSTTLATTLAPNRALLNLIAYKVNHEKEQLSFKYMVRFFENPYEYNEHSYVILSDDPMYSELQPNMDFFVRKANGYHIIYVNEKLETKEMTRGVEKDIEIFESDNHRMRASERRENRTKDHKSRKRWMRQVHCNDMIDIVSSIPEIIGEDLSLQKPILDNYKVIEDCSEYQRVEMRTSYKTPKSYIHLLHSVGKKYVITPTRIYVDRYLAREKSSTLVSDVQCDKPTFLGMRKWSLISDLVALHQRAIERYAVEAPERLISFNKNNDESKSRWVFNPHACDALFTYLSIIDNFFAGQHPVMKYLRLVDTEIIAPIFTEIARLKAKEKYIPSTPAKITQLNALLKTLADAIVLTLSAHLMLTEETFFKDCFDVLDPFDSLEKCAEIKNRPFKDEFLMDMHKAIKGVLTPYLISRDLPARSFLKERVGKFSEALATSFRDEIQTELFLIDNENFLPEEKVNPTPEQSYLQAKYELLEEIEKIEEAQRRGEDDNRITTESCYIQNIKIVKATKEVIHKIDELKKMQDEKKNTDYSSLIETLQATKAGLANTDRKAGGKHIQKHAKTLEGKPSTGWKILGAVLMGLGVVLVTAGVLAAATTFIPTFGVGLYAGCGASVLGLGLFALGSKAVHYGRQKSFSKIENELGHVMVTEAKVPAIKK